MLAVPAKPVDPVYVQRVAQALEGAWERAQAQAARPFNLASDRLIILSDLHKGARNGADDFARCERAYNSALAYYLRLGHTLVVLGDVEELWEEFPGPVVKAYAHALSLEAQFHAQGRYVRVWGNHDDDWMNADLVRRHLGPIFGEALTVQESLRLDVRDGAADGAATLGTLFLLHGHQGDPASDQWSGFSRWVVRYVWRPLQRLTRFSFNTPAVDWQLREKHNIALYSWAQQRSRLVLFAGHTHRPVFRSQTHAEQVQHVLEELEARLEAAPDDARLQGVVARTAAELEWVRAQELQAPGLEGAAIPMTKPCYFNTGCCCYVDGDLTGLELADGDVRLVRWPDNQGRPRPQILARASLRQVLAEC